MKPKPVTPYKRLLDATREYRRGVEHPRRVQMWLYGKAKLNAGWHLNDLYERVAAADQLGYDVRLIAADDGLRVEYVRRPVDHPMWYAL